MIRVSTADLRTRLGWYLKKVRGGEIIEVTSHSHSVARVIPYSGGAGIDLIEPSRPMSDLDDIGATRLKKPVDGVGALLQDRESR